MANTSMNRDDWLALQHDIDLDGRLVIGGARVESRTRAHFVSVNPATGKALAEVSSADESDVDDAVASARKAFDQGGWSGADAGERKATLLRFASLIESKATELALIESLDMGKPVSQSTAVDLPGCVATFRWYAELADKLADEIPSTPAGATALVTRVPVGVVGAIVPWNYPLEIASWKLAPALMAGNSVVLKPAEQSSLTALIIADLAVEAGIPPGVLNVVTGPGEVAGRALALHRGVDALTFTGSTAVAKSLMHYSADSNMKRLSLEAGGKSSNIVFADTADLRVAAEKSAFGAFYNQGEVCSANSRIFVEASIYEEFLRYLIEASQAYLPGDPLDSASGNGAMVSSAHADSVMDAIESGRQDGVVLAGGKRLESGSSDAFIAPTIIGELALDHLLHRDEIFGPVAVVHKFTSESDVVGAANATQYGLAASVWTSNLSRAHRVSAGLAAGTVSVNTVDALSLTTPFGGFKQSGFGRDLSMHAVDNYVGLKTTWIQHS